MEKDFIESRIKVQNFTKEKNEALCKVLELKALNAEKEKKLKLIGERSQSTYTLSTTSTAILNKTAACAGI